MVNGDPSQNRIISGEVDGELNLGGMINKFDFSELMQGRFACMLHPIIDIDDILIN